MDRATMMVMMTITTATMDINNPKASTMTFPIMGTSMETMVADSSMLVPNVKFQIKLEFTLINV